MMHRPGGEGGSGGGRWLCRAPTLVGVLFVVWSACCVQSPHAKVTTRRARKRPIQIINDSKSRIEVYWVSPDTREESLMSTEGGVMPGTEFPLDSWVGHEFVAKEVPTKDGKCASLNNGTCGAAFFAVSENDEQAVHITPEFQAVFLDNKVKAQKTAQELLDECRTKANEKLAAALANQGDGPAGQHAAAQAMDDLVKCVEGGVAGTLERLNEEIAFQASVRTGIAATLENYTCLDDGLNTTEDVHTEVWAHQGRKFPVHIKHERPASRIHVVENFIDVEECEAMERSAAKSLHRATVADGKGGSRLSENRKALQAGIKVDWTKEADGDPIARLSRRVYDYTNHVLGLNIKENGQEDLMSIQYEGRGRDDKEPDRYTPHCDGDCTGLPHKFGQRMATMVMYCSVPDKVGGGGHTNFRNAGVHVKPQSGNAIFFSYIDPETKLMDTGFTEHSGCPVFSGSKKIVTQWIRYGVDDENTWDSFNTLGIKLSDIKEYDQGEAAPLQQDERNEQEADVADEDEEEYFDEEEMSSSGDYDEEGDLGRDEL